MPLKIPSPQEFSISKDESTAPARWRKWKLAYSFYAIAIGQNSDTSDEQKIALVLHTAGSEIQEVFDVLTLASDSFEDAMNALDDYFKLKNNFREERFKFFEAQQGSGESFESFVMRLRSLAVSCEFFDEADTIIDKAIFGCRSIDLRNVLLKDRSLTLPDLLKIGRNFELHSCSGHSENKASNNLENNEATVEIKSVLREKSNIIEDVSQSGNSVLKKSVSSHIYFDCFRCGIKGCHKPSDTENCPATGVKCYSCMKIGHFSKMCTDKKYCQECGKRGHLSVHCIYPTRSYFGLPK